MLPNLLIIGAQKAATTSLHVYLDAHPHVFMSRTKELNFFAGPGWAWDRGRAWYEDQFPVAAAVRGESSPSYTAYPMVSGVPQRIHDLIPDTKLIYLVRDPVDRMVSQYIHVVGGGRERRTLREILAAPDFAQSGYVMKSRYAFQLEQYLPLFDRDRILVLGQEELLADRRRVLGSVFRFLGVDPALAPEGPDLRINTSEEKRRPRALARAFPRLKAAARNHGVARALLTREVAPPDLDPTERSRLEDLVREDAARLRALTGMTFEEWSV